MTPLPSATRHAALRLMPGTDLRAGLEAARATLDASAAAVVACVGSLTHATLRHAGREDGSEHPGPLEIVSLSGTLGAGGAHLHLGVSDARGRMAGGHLLYGATVRTTAEIVLAILDDLHFARESCAISGYAELVITRC
ncbi:MAG: PPC domain-containing DNA-binding protein [Paracoccaceae bacterium]